MTRPIHLWSACGLVAVVWLVSALVRAAEPPAPPLPKLVTLPLREVTLYTAGVGYFRHAGDVDGNVRTELRFPEADVNDLIKSLVLTDTGGGKVKAVTYDNRAPIEFTLKAFSIDLTDNPTIGQLLHQVRGERVAVTDRTGSTLTGMIVSIERPPSSHEKETPSEQVNLLTVDGIQSVELRQAKKISFVKPELQEEFVKALGVLAASRGDPKKGVSIHFAGNGKRQVGVGYVVEAPIWKASYRLALDDKGATRLQGWATVENTTDEDWTNVKVGLAAGRPVSFQMDLYDPLFVPRPQVELDLYASLRPPMYQGVLTPLQGMQGGAIPQVPQANFLGNTGAGLNAGGIGGGGFQGQLQGNFTGQQGGNLGGQIGIQGNFNGFNGGLPQYRPRIARPHLRDLYGSWLGYQDYLTRLKGGEAAKEQETLRDPFDPKSGVASAAEAGRLGDNFRYTIEEPVTLPRMKSALLPILNEAVEGTRVSIYNQRVLGKHPLLGLKLANKTKLHLAQGPITVYDGDSFAGDARLPDLQPGETRLVSYAIDLGTEVLAREVADEERSTLVAASVADGHVVLTTRHRTTKRYIARNRDTKDRVLLIEHPIRDGWKVTAPALAVERSRDFHRFEVPIKAGQAATLDVVEEMTHPTSSLLADRSSSSLLGDSKDAAVKPAVRAILAKIIELRDKVGEIQKGLVSEQAALKDIGEEQSRIRANLERVPKDSDAYRRYLKKFDDQETEIETRQLRVKELRTELTASEKALKDFLATAKAE